MVSLSISTHLAAFSLLIFTLRASAADSNSSFSFTKFGKDPNFESNIALYGDAKIANGAVQLTSSGRVMYKKPLKLGEGKPQKSVSFSSHFTLSMSKENGDGLAFVIVPSGFNLSLFGNSSFGLEMGYGKSKLKVVAVKLKYDYLVGKVHVGIDVGSSVSARVNNASAIKLNLTSGDRTNAWIDYEAGSKRVEVRLSQLGGLRPADPLLWYPIDLSKLWGDEKVFVGLSAQNRNSSQTCSIYSWSFEQRHVPDWMHSEPLDPKTLSKSSKPVTVEKRKDCVLRAVAAMVLGVACGALASYIVLYLWRVFGNRRPVVPEEYAMQPQQFEYKKMKVVVDKSIEDGKQ
ncbi:putative non-specific serine/threonine protein kinase [Rosa chinensis]|uniref:Putative non-specific serine/threonine protein kinase n=1 Tax=Rosa chinensis TaxID=74649 RepID=A0A2P6R9F6_ROSCH|nr:L-type lectin-domain containing receptor kinase VIII.2 [Rosa chinensis]PRQ43041.1 putative non-specific serine/threonine protein kinase [Rosa chinensis]